MNRRSLLRAATIGAVAPVVTGAPALAASASGDPSLRRPPGATSPVPSRPVTTLAPTLASRLTTLPPETEQVIIVHGDGYATTYATLEIFSKTFMGWQQSAAPMPARIGSKGFSDNHVEGVATTPTGVYSIGPTMYGIAANPSVLYPYHQLVSGDWWNENPSSPGYNTFQHSSTNPGGASEALWLEKPAYTHFAVITYNMPPNVPTPIPNAGSGIFLHEFSVAGGNATAGCVSLSHDNLVRVLTWLNPAKSPRIVISPTANLGRY